MNEQSIGEKINRIRTEKGLSLRKLAGLAEITPSMLSQIERDQVNPSIATVRSIADCLGVPLYRFFIEETPDTMVVHPDKRLSIGYRDSPDVFYEMLVPDTKGDIEFGIMIIPPGMSTSNKAHSHIGEEMDYVLSGEVEIEINGSIYELKARDSIRIPPRALHLWHNRGTEKAQVIFAITPFSF